jgi:hypothetical protein
VGVEVHNMCNPFYGTGLPFNHRHGCLPHLGRMRYRNAPGSCTSPTVIAGGQTLPLGITVDATTAYWLAQLGDATLSYRVLLPGASALHR